MITIEIREEAQAEILAAFAWYDEKRRGLGQQFIASLDVVMERISHHARSFPVVEHGIRKAILRRFPYVVFFELGNDRATILAVYHGHRPPRRWSERVSEPLRRLIVEVDEETRIRALSLRGSLSANEANKIRKRTAQIRSCWR
jgi:toxin ParE1/3/4